MCDAGIGMHMRSTCCPLLPTIAALARQRGQLKRSKQPHGQQSAAELTLWAVFLALAERDERCDMRSSKAPRCVATWRRMRARSACQASTSVLRGLSGSATTLE